MWWTIAGACLAIPAVVLLVARAVPWGIGTPWIQLLAGLPYVAGLLVLAFLVSLLGGGRAAATVSGAVAVVLLIALAVLVPRFIPSGPSASGQNQLTVMSLNVDGGQAMWTGSSAWSGTKRLMCWRWWSSTRTWREAWIRPACPAELPFKALSVDWVGHRGRPVRTLSAGRSGQDSGHVPSTRPGPR